MCLLPSSSFFSMPISCHNLHNVPLLPSLAWCRNLIPGQHNDGSPSRVRLLGGSQCLQPSRTPANFLILLGARKQEGQADDSKNGPASSGLHQKLDPRYKMPWEILREKNRGMATKRTWNVPESLWNCPERLQKGPRKAPERSWLSLCGRSLHTKSLYLT